MILPESNNVQNDQCSEPSRRLICFRAGDNARVNQHPGLMVLHTIWVNYYYYYCYWKIIIFIIK